MLQCSIWVAAFITIGVVICVKSGWFSFGHMNSVADMEVERTCLTHIIRCGDANVRFPGFKTWCLPFCKWLKLEESVNSVRNMQLLKARCLSLNIMFHLQIAKKKPEKNVSGSLYLLWSFSNKAKQWSLNRSSKDFMHHCWNAESGRVNCFTDWGKYFWGGFICCCCCFIWSAVKITMINKT